jgi:GT2 family glycosyltransferase
VRGWDLAQPHEVDVVQGTCLLLRRRAVEAVGFLDEGYFMYSEEVDLCHRLRQSGWRVWWVPKAVVLHYGGCSTRQVRAEMFVHLYRSKVRFFRKNHGAAIARGYKGLLALAALTRIPFYMLRWLPGQVGRARVEKARLYGQLLAVLPAL